MCVQSDSLGVEWEFTNQGKPPNIEWHLAHKSEDFDLIAVSICCHTCVPTFYSP